MAMRSRRVALVNHLPGCTPMAFDCIPLPCAHKNASVLSSARTYEEQCMKGGHTRARASPGTMQPLLLPSSLLTAPRTAANSAVIDLLHEHPTEPKGRNGPHGALPISKLSTRAISGPTPKELIKKVETQTCNLTTILIHKGTRDNFHYVG